MVSEFVFIAVCSALAIVQGWVVIFIVNKLSGMEKRVQENKTKNEQQDDRHNKIIMQVNRNKAEIEESIKCLTDNNKEGQKIMHSLELSITKFNGTLDGMKHFFEGIEGRIDKHESLIDNLRFKKDK